MIAWCLYLIGNRVSCVPFRPEQPPGGGGGSIKLMRWDGHVKIYERPIEVSELMLEFPKHRVCRSDSFYIGQKIPALSDEDQLLPGHNYFLLPKHFFQSALSFVTVASFAAASTNTNTNTKKNAFVKKKAASSNNCQPFHMQKTSSGSVRIRVSEEFISQLMEQGRIKEKEEEEEQEQDQDGNLDKGRSSRVCTTVQLQKEYSQLVGYSRSRQSCWKPKLETIKESTTLEKKKKKKLGSFGVKKLRKKSQH